MSLPGVESARRRRVSHEKKTTSSNFSTFSFRLNQRLNTHHYTPTQLMRGTDMVAGTVGWNFHDEIGTNESELVDDHHRRVAMDARARLHEKLRRLNGHNLHGSAHHCRHHRHQQEASIAISANSRTGFQSITSLLHKTKSIVPIAMPQQQIPESDNEHNGNESTCPVCLDTLALTLDKHDYYHHNVNVAKHQVVTSLPCGHTFHLDCLLLWLSSAAASTKNCPLCRAAITSPPFAK